MPDLPAHPPPGPSPPLRSYEEFLEDIKARIRTAQARAARAINTELVEVYWQVGREILRRQAQEGPERGRRTPGVIQRLSADLRAAFPGARGYSVPSLYRMRALAAAWPERLSDRMRDLPWGHIVTITTKATEDTRDWYAERAAASSQEQLEDAIATRLHQREAAAITNFARTLEAGDAVAVQRITRDPLILDFVELAESARERDLEAALPSDIERFMLALGEGFYFAGRQRSLQVGGDEFVLDLLFYTTRPAACRHRPEGPPLPRGVRRQDEPLRQRRQRAHRPRHQPDDCWVHPLHRPRQDRRAAHAAGHRDADRDHPLHDRQARSRDDRRGGRDHRRRRRGDGVDARRVEQRVAEFAARRASELAHSTGPRDPR